MKIHLMFFMLAFLFSCSTSDSDDQLSASDYRPSVYEKMAEQITKQIATQLKEQKNLIIIGTGGKMMHNIQQLMMAFNYYKIVDIEIARGLLFEIVEKYLSAINSNEEIREYLNNYPFAAKNVEIIIYFRQPDGSQVASDKINIASANEGWVTYYIRDYETHRLKPVLKETYVEAKQKVYRRLMK